MDWGRYRTSWDFHCKSKEEELIISDEEVISPGISLMQKDRNTDTLRIAYESPKTPARIYKYNIITKEKKSYIYDPSFVVKHHYTPEGKTWKGIENGGLEYSYWIQL